MRRSRPIGVGSVGGNCGKKRYPHKRAAEQAAERQMHYAAEKSQTLDLRVYECKNSWCTGWHLTEKRD